MRREAKINRGARDKQSDRAHEAPSEARLKETKEKISLGMRWRWHASEGRGVLRRTEARGARHVRQRKEEQRKEAGVYCSLVAIMPNQRLWL